MTPAELLARVDALGGYCVLATPRDGEGWRPLDELVSARGELERRAARLRAGSARRVGVPFADVDARAAASTMHLGLAARLLSPTLAVTLLGGVVPDLRTQLWHWREPVGAEPSVGLGAVELTGREAPGTLEQAAAFRELVLAPVLLALEDGVHAGCGVSRRVLRGNLASALAGTVTALAAADPALRRPALGLVSALLRRRELADHGRYVSAGGFRRNSCCLYYRLPGGGLCGDCVLAGVRPSRAR